LLVKSQLELGTRLMMLNW